MRHNDIITVKEVLTSSPSCCFQSGNDLRVVRFSIIEGRLILKNDEESSGNGFPGSNRLDQIVVVLLELFALRILLILHVPLNRIEMLTDVRFFGQDFDLNLDRADFQPTGKDATIFFCSRTLRRRKLMGSTSKILI